MEMMLMNEIFMLGQVKVQNRVRNKNYQKSVRNRKERRKKMC